jgi:putative CocE/NonD family hydrolase
MPDRHPFRVAWDARIPARDGIELSANIWIPEPAGAEDPAAADECFPAILEMIPYGKDNWRRNSDVARGEWLAARGYALCRVDVRGTGSSGGIALDEYTAAETQDGYEAVEWLAAQPWCTGNVAMWGISYGGFTSIQVAALRPPHLRAIVPIMATDDRYRDDVHYRGGCHTVSEQSQYSVSQVGMNAMPPDAGFRGAAWRDEWLVRLEATPPWTLEWLRHQTDGPYYRQGSLAPDYDRIEVPILAYTGWHDSYVDPAFRMQERCIASPERLLVSGPWGHGLPDSAEPGPTLGWMPEMLAFLDRHLRGAEGPPMPSPAVRWFRREWSPPVAFPAALAGEWLGADAYPIPGTESVAWRFTGGGGPMVGRLVADDADADAALSGTDRVRHRPTLGTAGTLSWGAGGAPNGLARDLRPDEALSLTYTSEPLTEPLDALGFPEAILHLEADAEIATVVVRLTDVAPDGTSAQVSSGILNLTHRRSDEELQPLVPGRLEEVRVPLRALGYRWLAGHRIRVSVGTQAWPIIWPSPLPLTLTVHRGRATPSRLSLPVLTPAALARIRPAPSAETSPPSDLRQVGSGDEHPPVWRIEEDVVAGSVTVHVYEGGTTVLEDGRSLFSSERLDMTAFHEDPATAILENDVVYRWHDHDFTTEIRATGRTTSDVASFFFDLRLEVDLDGSRFFERAWHEIVPRHLV